MWPSLARNIPDACHQKKLGKYKKVLGIRQPRPPPLNSEIPKKSCFFYLAPYYLLWSSMNGSLTILWRPSLNPVDNIQPLIGSKLHLLQLSQIFTINVRHLAWNVIVQNFKHCCALCTICTLWYFALSDIAQNFKCYCAIDMKWYRAKYQAMPPCTFFNLCFVIFHVKCYLAQNFQAWSSSLLVNPVCSVSP